MESWSDNVTKPRESSGVVVTQTDTVTTKSEQPEKDNGLAPWGSLPVDFIGRDGGIRTHDPLHPMQVRYQAALRPDLS